MNTQVADPVSCADPVEAFYREVIELLKMSAPRGPASAQAPDLLVRIGPADLDAVRHVRDSLPPSSYLFWLYPAADSGADLPVRPWPSSRTLTCPLTEQSYYRDRLGLFVSVIASARIEVSVDDALRGRCEEETRLIHKSIQAALDNASNHATRGLIRLRCSIANLPRIVRDSSRRMKPVPPGHSAIVCGAGPSLTSQLDALRAAAEKTTLLAVGHAVPVLVRAGIEPDVVVEGDSVAFQNWPDDVRPRGVLAALTEVSPEVAARFSRAVWFNGCAMPFNVAMSTWGVPLGDVRLNKTVTVQAIDLALRAGFDRIALVGQDLSVTDSGQLHAGGNRVDEFERLFELPGNEGRTVYATEDLAGLHEAVQSFLQEVSARLGRGGRDVLIANCTAGGARIDGACRMTLAAFLDSIPSAQKPDVIDESSAPVDPAGPIGALNDGLGAYIPAARQIVHDCRRMQREVDASPVDVPKLRRLQDELRQHIQAEEVVKDNPALDAWVNPLMDAVDGVLKKTPGLMSESTDPHIQLRFLQTRYDFMADLCADIRRDIDAARAGMHRSGPAPARSPYRFDSFRRFSLRLLARGNKELAHFLEKETSPPDRFRFHWINQYIPYVNLRQGDSAWCPLTSFVSMFEQARSDVDRFLRASGWTPGASGVVFAVPGNWAHVLEFSARFPDAEVMVVDPWIELLSAMIDRGCFLNRLPQTALVIGLHPDLGEAAALCRTRLREWRERGLGCAVFPHPRAEGVADIAAACGDVVRWVVEAGGLGEG